MYQLDLEANDTSDERYWHVSKVTYYKDGKAQAGTYLKDGVVQVKEDPQNDPITVLIKKNSANGEKIKGSDVEKQSQGAATYKDAEFTVYYYDTTDVDTLKNDNFKNHDWRVKNAKRTWVFNTDANGEIWTDTNKILKYYDAEDSPSELYYTTDDKGTKFYTFPVGTYVIEETDAPAGFTAPTYDKRTFIEVIYPENNPTSDVIYTYHKKCYTPIDTDKYEGLGWSAWYLPGETKK